MAEGLARKLLPSGVRVLSAGSQPAYRVNPYAVRAMSEIGIDISGHHPRGVADIPWGDLDRLITVCAEESVITAVPASGMIRENWNLPDPAAVIGSEEQIMAAFRNTRDQIKEKLKHLIRAVH